ncbi:hypothetical protein Cgig2_016816 [Carnegiea gigantea]|uniref:Uncharacterized protein n=1 Tax=Carnegiea gigantea TaxID=171969 RepID=A0A9Q1GMN1_9CARY|nr:hypothetical protein Cgig2_016816 [Carnegiea gigantea]
MNNPNHKRQGFGQAGDGTVPQASSGDLTNQQQVSSNYAAQLNKDHFSDIQIKFATAKERLSNLRMHTQNNPLQQTLYEEETRLVAKYQLWHDRLESFCLQKTKEDWLNLGDTNDKHCYDKLKQHHHLNGISSIREADGNWSCDYDRVIQHFLSYYEDFLGTPAVTNRYCKFETKWLQGIIMGTGSILRVKNTP